MGTLKLEGQYVYVGEHGHEGKDRELQTVMHSPRKLGRAYRIGECDPVQ